VSAKPNGSKNERGKPTAPERRGGGVEGDRGKGLSQFSLITLWHVTGNHRAPAACPPLYSSRPHVCHTLTLDLQQLFLQPAAGVYLSSVALETARAKCH